MIFYGTHSRRTLAEEAGYDGSAEDTQQPAAHLRIDGDPLPTFADEVRALRFVGALTRCSHHHCRTSLTEETVAYCPHDYPFCEMCTWEDACDECAAFSVGVVA